MEKQLAEMKKEVFLRRPVLKEIAEKYSQFSLFDYVKKVWEISPISINGEFLESVEEITKEIYGSVRAEQIIAQLKSKPLVSTIDHLGIWNHPFFVNSDLIYSLHFEPNELAPIFATEGVSLNNTWSACLLWHENEKMKRVSFLSDKLKTLPVISTPAISGTDLDRFNQATQNQFKDLAKVLDLESISKSFSTQACIGSSKLWQAVFPSAPKLIYLPLETMVSNYLIKILDDGENPITKIILSSEGNQLWQKYFGNEPTFLFYGLDDKGRRETIKELPQNIINQLKNKQIYPASPLCFLVLLSAGVTCVGGFNQTSWLTNVKQKLMNFN